MATRQETQNKRQRMREAIMESCRSGRVQPGALFPTVRDLAREYGLSVNLASEVVQSLVAEGVLHARPGAGTVAGNPLPGNAGTYLFLLPEGTSREDAAGGYIGVVQRGFEVSIAQLGGACLALEAEQAREYATAGQLPLLAGVFSINAATLHSLPCGDEVPLACFGEPAADAPTKSAIFDAVHFDDFNGGKQATQHLLSAGYESIAFLALHAPEAPGDFGWSAERENGWREAMSQAGKSYEEMAFHPLKAPSLHAPRKGPYLHGSEQMEAAREAVAPLLTMIREGGATAVVAANFFAARALFGMLQEARIAPIIWPAVVCFDGFNGLDNHVVSALNLPWDEIGKAGAQLLWERNVGRLRGQAAVRLVPMQLIPRLTSRPNWTKASSLVVPSLGVLSSPRVESGFVKAAA